MGRRHFRSRSRGFFVAGLLAFLCPVASGAQHSPAGRWEGLVTVDGQPVPVVVQFVARGAAFEGTLDLVSQGARALPLSSVRFDPPRVRFELGAGTEPTAFDGVLEPETMRGTVKQGARSGTFELKRIGPAVAAPAPEAPARARPAPRDTPSAPVPAAVSTVSEEVSIGAGTVTLAGTLTRPRAGGPFPGVVLLSTNGPHSRDGEMYGFAMLRQMAEHLVAKGIAVLRCDDRGVGGSSGVPGTATTADSADDALAQVRLLEGRPEIVRTPIGIVGHGEGGVVAALAASRSPAVAFVVSLSGPALTGEQVLLAQAERINRASGVPEARIRRNAEMQRQLFAAVRTGAGWREVAASMARDVKAAIEAMPASERAAIGDPDLAAKAAADARIASARTPWFRFYLDYDPVPALERLRCPVLALFGERDLEVAAEANAAAMEQAFRRSGRRDLTVRVVPGVNHLYQEAKTGNVSEYPSLKPAFARGVLDLVSGWILEQAARSAR